VGKRFQKLWGGAWNKLYSMGGGLKTGQPYCHPVGGGEIDPRTWKGTGQMLGKHSARGGSLLKGKSGMNQSFGGKL